MPYGLPMPTSSRPSAHVARILAVVAALACSVNAWVWARDAMRIAPLMDVQLANDLLLPPEYLLERGCVLLAVAILTALAGRALGSGARPRALAHGLACVVVIWANAVSPASFFFDVLTDPSALHWARDSVLQLVTVSTLFAGVALACMWWAWSPTTGRQSSGQSTDQSEPSVIGSASASS